MRDPKKLTASHIRYLIAMKKVPVTERGIRCVDLAARLGYSKPSVHKMMDSLAGMGLIGEESYGAVRFTDLGESVASRYFAYYGAVSGMLREYFPGGEELEGAACALLASLPEEGLCEFTERQNERSSF